MKTVWEEAGQRRAVTAPLSLIVTAFAPVTDVRRALTPAAPHRPGPDRAAPRRPRARPAPPGRLARWRRCTASSATAPPDLDDPALLRAFFAAIQELQRGGPAARLPRPLRRRAAGRRCWRWRSPAGRGLAVDLAPARPATRGPSCSPRSWAPCSRSAPRTPGAGRARPWRPRGWPACVHRIGRPGAGDRIVVRQHEATLLDAPRTELRGIWSETTCAHAGGCATTPPAPTRSRQGRRDADDPGPARRTSPSTPTEDVAAPVRRARRAAARSPSCASRASTGRSRWRPRSTAPASRRSTCT